MKLKTVKRAITPTLAALVCIAAAAGSRVAAGAEVSESGMVVLGKGTRYRAFLAFRTPVVVDAEGKVKTAMQPTWNRRKQKGPRPLDQYQSPLPPEAWTTPGFEDLAWRHCSAPLEVEAGVGGGCPSAMHSATKSSIIFLRSKFKVDDPARVRGLKLSLSYVGGVAVYVNGKEVERAHLPEGELQADTLAENYPADLYVLPNNDAVTINDLNPKWNRKNCRECQAAYQRRYRQLKDFPIDAGLLRKGANVLALRIHRAAVNEAATKASNPPGGARRYVKGLSAYVGLKDLIVTAAAGSAIRPNTGRAKGVTLWNCTPYEDLSINSFCDPGDPLRPIEIAAARNGTFSGRFAIGSDAEVRGLKITLSTLRTADGKAELPAEAVRLRHARRAPWNLPWRKSVLFDGLYDGAPARIEYVKEKISTGWRKSESVDGAVLPVWITVKVPKDVTPGLYEGKVTVAATGLEKTEIPVKCRVYAGVLPDPRDFLIHNLATLAPENLAMHYKVPLWSGKHFELMAKSLKLMFDTGSRRVEIDLATDYHGVPGNTQSIVRWIKQPDGSFKHDFSILDKYFDLIEKTIGKPRPLRLNCWPAFVKNKGEEAKCVSVLDPKTGKLERYEQPTPGTPESIKFWKPVLDGIRERAKKRGWEDVLSLGHQSYCSSPAKQLVTAVHQMWPEAVWSFTSHNSQLGQSFGGGKGVRMPVLYGAGHWTMGALGHRGYRHLLARIEKPNIWAAVMRDWYRDGSPVFKLRRLPEEVIMRGHNGLGQMGADLFPIEAENKGKRKGRPWHHNYNRGGIGPEFSTRCILAAGKDGPIATERYEMFREGVQLCEIILRLQRMLDAKKITGALAKRVNDCLERRSRAYLGGYWEGQLERDRELLEIAGEAAGEAQLAGR